MSRIRPYRPSDRAALYRGVHEDRGCRRGCHRDPLGRLPLGRPVRGALRGAASRPRVGRRDRRRAGRSATSSRPTTRRPSTPGSGTSGGPHSTSAIPRAETPTTREERMIDLRVHQAPGREPHCRRVSGAPAHRPAARDAGAGARADSSSRPCSTSWRVAASPVCTSAWTRTTPAQQRSTSVSV